MDKLTPKQHKALPALLVHATHAEAAQAAGISERTLQYWLADATFKAAYQEAQRAAMQQALDTVMVGTFKAASKLISLLDCGRPTVELQAARVLLEQGLKVFELNSLAERITQLERQQQ